jgi:hypothetical protein
MKKKKSSNDIRSKLAEYNEEMVVLEGFDNAIIGVAHQYGQPPVALYDIEKIVKIIMKEESCTKEEAEEFVHYNIVNAHFSDSNPIYMEKIK